MASRIQAFLPRDLIRITSSRSIPLWRAGTDDVTVVVAPERIRIVVAGLPRMLAEIIDGAVAAQDDMELVARLGAHPLTCDSIAEDPHVVILGLEDIDSILALLAARPRVSVIGVLAQGREACLYRTQPQRTALGELSPDNLVSAIRSAARAAWSFEHAPPSSAPS